MKTLSTFCLTIALAACLSGCPESTPTQKAVANPSGGGVAGFVGSANKVKLKAGLTAVLKAAKTYQATKGETPEDVETLVTEGLLTAEQGTDLWGNDYMIIVDGNQLSVETYGADNAEGGEGPNKDWSTDDLR
jgi:hypothetical protein